LLWDFVSLPSLRRRDFPRVYLLDVDSRFVVLFDKTAWGWSLLLLVEGDPSFLELFEKLLLFLLVISHMLLPKTDISYFYPLSAILDPMRIRIHILILHNLRICIYGTPLISTILNTNSSWRLLRILQSFNLSLVMWDVGFSEFLSHDLAQILLFWGNFYPLFFSVGRDVFGICGVISTLFLYILNSFWELLLVFDNFYEIVTWIAIQVIFFIHIPFP